MVNNIMRSALLVLLAVSISACGFHLRGNIPLPESVANMFVSAPEGPFKDQLEKVLIKAGAVLAASPQGADVVLLVTSAATNRTIGTLDERGKANSYNLRFQVKYTLQAPDGENIRPPANLVESRRYNFDPVTVVETESEEAELQESMEQDISLRIVRKLSTVTDYVAK